MNRKLELAHAAAAIAVSHFEKAIQLLEPLAESGDSEAQFQLGMLGFEGAEVSQEFEYGWLKKAADQAHPEAMYRLGVSPIACEIFPEFDVVRRRELLFQAAELGSVGACHALGVSYATGDWDGEGDGPKDDVEACKWYGRAAEGGDADAKYNLATMALYGEGCAKDAVKAIEMMQEAALCGNESSSRHLETLFTEGADDIAPDASLADIWRALGERQKGRAGLSEK